MGCGCKNKGNNPPTPSSVQTSGNKTATTTNQNSIQESVKKVIEKYYNKK